MLEIGLELEGRRMRRKHWASCTALAAAALLCACAANPPATGSIAVSPEETKELAARATAVDMARLGPTPDDAICRKESVTGSHRPRTVCQTKAQRDSTREAAQDWYRSRGRNGEITQIPTVH